MLGCVADVLLVDTKKDLSMYQDGEGAKSVTPCCVGGASCGPDTTQSARKKLDYDLGEYICMLTQVPSMNVNHAPLTKVSSLLRDLWAQVLRQEQGAEADCSHERQQEQQLCRLGVLLRNRAGQGRAISNLCMAAR